MQLQEVCHKYFAAFKNDLQKQDTDMDHENHCKSYKRNFVTNASFIAAEDNISLYLLYSHSEQHVDKIAKAVAKDLQSISTLAQKRVAPVVYQTQVTD